MKRPPDDPGGRDVSLAAAYQLSRRLPLGFRHGGPIRY